MIVLITISEQGGKWTCKREIKERKNKIYETAIHCKIQKIFGLIVGIKLTLLFIIRNKKIEINGIIKIKSCY